MSGDTLKPVSLRGLRPFGEGRFRQAFVHPGDETKCIKIERLNSTTASRSPLRFGRKDLSGNEREVLEYRRLIAQGIPYERYFPRFYGVIDTDLGKGLCVELLQGTDRKLPLSLKQCIKMGLLQEESLSRYVAAAYEKFAYFCEQNLILSASVGFENVGIVFVDGAPKLVSFDIKTVTSKQMIPLADWFTVFKRARVRRRFTSRIEELRTLAASAAPTFA
jgi:hypothetical protein